MARLLELVRQVVEKVPLTSSCGFSSLKSELLYRSLRLLCCDAVSPLVGLLLSLDLFEDVVEGVIVVVACFGRGLGNLLPSVDIVIRVDLLVDILVGNIIAGILA